MRRCYRIRSARAPLLVTWVGFAIFGAFGGVPAAAQNERGEREIEAAKERIHLLQREAEELREAGRADKADALRHEARQLEERLHRHLEQRRQKEHGGGPSEILERLEMGMSALRELGRHEELERLEHIAAGLRERLRHQAEQRQRAAAVAEPARKMLGRSEQSRPGDDREAVLRNLKIMRYAVEALAESQHPDAADLVERALRAREMALEGRRDEEARRMRASGPDRAQLVELLAMAGEILQDRGRSERAAAVGQLSGQLHERLRRDRRRPRETDRRGGADRLQRFMERVETLEQRLTGIERMMERLRKAIETLKDDGD